MVDHNNGDGFKCKMCPRRTGNININDAKSCFKCNALYHSSCAKKTTVTAEGIFAYCCGDKAITRSHKGEKNVMKGRSNSTSTTRPIKPPAPNTQVDVPVSNIQKDMDLRGLDVSGLALWNLINPNLSNIKDTLDNINHNLKSTNIRIDKLEDRVCQLEGSSAVTSDLVIKEMKERQLKEKNIIILNLADSPTAKNTDLDAVKKIFTDSREQLPFSLDELRVQRLGKVFDPKKTRLLRVIFPSSIDVHWVFKNRKKFLNDTLIIKNDLTKNQLNHYYKVRDDLRSRVEGGEDDLSIRHRFGVPIIVKKNESVRGILGNQDIQTDHNPNGDDQDA